MRWIRIVREPAARRVVAGALLLTLAIWGTVGLFVATLRGAALDQARRDTTNLTIAFEQHLSYLFRSIDDETAILKRRYEADPAGFDLRRAAGDLPAMSGVTFQIARFDAAGDLRESSLDTADLAANVADRPHFKVHAGGSGPGLYIAEPVISRSAGRPALIVSRRLERPDSGFDGTLAVSLDPAVLSGFLGAIDVGPDGIVAVWGTDGVIRARASRGAPDPRIGQPETRAPLFAQSGRAGSYRAVGVYDGVERVFAFRHLERFPLIVVVAVATHDVLAGATRQGWIAAAIGLIATLAIAIGSLSLARGAAQRRRSHLALLESRDALARSEARLRMLIARMPAAFSLKDRQLRFRMVNAHFEALHGLREAEIVGCSWDELAVRHSRPDWVAAAERDRRALESETQITEEIEVIAPDGERRTLVLTQFLLHDGSAGGVSVATIATDVTALKIAQLAAARSEKLATLGQLTGGVAHDMNNVMSVITLGLESILDEPDIPAVPADTARRTLNAAHQGARLARALLGFARRQAIEPQRLELGDAVAAAVALFQPTVGARWQIALERAETATPCVVDKATLDTALLNLLLNARDAMPDGGLITVTCGPRSLAGSSLPVTGPAAPGHYAAVSVRDRGPGIPTALVDRIFDPFFTTREGRGGTGLGLSMVFGFVKQSGGHILVETPDDGGACLTLLFPLASPAPPAGAPDASAPAAPTPAAALRGRALVVEDRDEVRAMVVQHCLRLGLAVDEAASYEAARHALQAGACPDFLLTDVVLGTGGTGFDLARAALAACPAIRVVAMSGYSETGFPADLEARGAVFLSKPFNRAELQRALEKRQPCEPPSPTDRPATPADA